MVAGEVFRLQLPGEAFFETADAKTAAERLHACRPPHSIANGEDFRTIIDLGSCSINRIIECHSGCDGPSQLDPVGHPWGGVGTAINA
jgi:hypothetical protein